MLFEGTSPLNNLYSLINYVALPLTHEDLLGEFVEDIVAKYNYVHFAGAQQVIQSGGYKLSQYRNVLLFDMKFQLN